MMAKEVSEKPITFNIDMVRATITCARCGKMSIPFPCEHCGSEDFVKTVTRRVIKHQPDGKHFILERRRHSVLVAEIVDGVISWRPYGGAPLQPMPIDEIAKYAPYQVGDHLWEKETYREVTLNNGYMGIHYKVDDALYYGLTPYGDNVEITSVGKKCKCGFMPGKYKWKSSRFMSKWAARIWLKVLNVRPEELQDISINDIRAEGVRDTRTIHNEIVETYFEKFQQLWDSLNAKGGHLWELNPLVWRYEFKRIKK
jgi:hypothetical protein